MIAPTLSYQIWGNSKAPLRSYSMEKIAFLSLHCLS